MQSALTGYAYSLTSNMDDAKDLVQESYLRALNNRDKFDDNTNLKAWMFTILRNIFINSYNRKVRTSYVASSDVNEYVLNSKPSAHDPESDCSFNELNEKVAEMEPQFRVPFQMYDMGYKYNEIADELGLKLGTVKSRIHFSRKKLMDQIDSD